MFLFEATYYILLTLLHIVAIPYLLIKSKQSKYKKAIPARFFLKDNKRFKTDGIWFHSCSMGETKALKPLIEHYKNKKCNVNLSVATNTGFQEGKKYIEEVRYLPFETLLPFWQTKQKVLVVAEAELWLMLFFIAKIKKTKTVLLNARVSDSSYQSYKKFSFLYKKIFKNIDIVFAQSKLDKERLIELGASNVEVCGNIKLWAKPELKNSFKKQKQEVLTAASTHSGEEKLILQAYEKKYGKLIVVPRHPERFDEVYKLIEKYAEKKGLSYSRYSFQKSFDFDIILIDKMGMLNDIYSISDIVILGGAFEKIGGHNPIEPAHFGCKIVSGKNIFNQKSLFSHVKNYVLIEKEELKNILDKKEELKKSVLNISGSYEKIIKEIDANL
ncbi:MAG: lipid IV(A) 3-deoxy-D-manno-octulosonic acid transferase [Campylobacterota bacterium]